MSQIEKMPPIEQSLSIVRGQMSTTRRWLYRLLLVAVVVITGGLVSLWVTEPGPLPSRLHVAFAAMTTIGLGWICVLSWSLFQRHSPTAVDRIATGWMATTACLISLVVSVMIALLRGNNWAAAALAIAGLVLLGVAVWLLRSSYAFRAKLISSLNELEENDAFG